MIDPGDPVSSMPLEMVEVGPTKATAQDVPRDAQWLEQQKSSDLVYFPINGLKGEIRLLRVKEALFRADIVECDLITTFLDQCGDFIALSYCWGSDKQNGVMLCNGKRRHITASLNDALKAFRESGHTRGRLLWADAVSIDQHNEAEKSEQIPLMRRIYSEANACFVHLGQRQPRVTQGLDLMLRLALLQNHLASTERPEIIPMNALFTLLPSRGHTCWTEYMTIFTLPWFARTWTLQEIALSDEALLGIGRYVIDWSCVQDSYNFLEEHNLLLRVCPRQEGAMLRIFNFQNIQTVLAISRSFDGFSALIELLIYTRESAVTDPRDKIFAILGMIGNLPDGLKSLVDYNLSAGEIFHRAAMYMFKHPKSDNLLAHAGLQRQSGQWDMPSWVPDWYCVSSPYEMPLMLYRPDRFLAGGPRHDFWPQVGSAISTPRELINLGLFHQKISHASDPYANAKGPTYADFEAFYAWLDSARRCIESSGSLVYDDVEEAVAQTFLIGYLYTNNEVSAAPIQNPKKTFRAAMAKMNGAKRSKNPQEAFDGLCWPLKKCPVQTFILQMTSVMRGRRFAITDTGYTCLVPACAEIGDAVAVFSGHPTPFTIRLKRVSEMSETGWKRVHAQLIGDTYMHGVMYGEMITEAMKTGRKLCEIVLI